MTLQTTQPSKIMAMAKNRLGKKTAILVTNASQKPVTVTTAFINSSLTPQLGHGEEIWAHVAVVNHLTAAPLRTTT
jgi:hypothetical protein